MRLKRRIATLLAFIMAFSSVAAFGVSADSFAPSSLAVPVPFGAPTAVLDAAYDAAPALHAALMDLHAILYPLAGLSLSEFNTEWPAVEGGFTAWVDGAITITSPSPLTYTWHDPFAPVLNAIGYPDGSGSFILPVFQYTWQDSLSLAFTTFMLTQGPATLGSLLSAVEIYSGLVGIGGAGLRAAISALTPSDAPDVAPTVTLPADLPADGVIVVNRTYAQSSSAHTINLAATGTPTPTWTYSGGPTGTAVTDGGDGTAVLTIAARGGSGHTTAATYPVVVTATNSEGSVNVTFVVIFAPTVPTPPGGLTGGGIPANTWINLPPFLHGPIGSVEVPVFLHDRYREDIDVVAPAGSPFDNINLRTERAPEIILPMGMFPGGFGTIEITMTGWGDTPWAHMTAQLGNIMPMRANSPAAPARVAAGQAGTWARTTATSNMFIYSGVDADPGNYFGEMPFHLEISGQTIRVTPIDAFGVNDVLRIPLLARPNALNVRTVPTVTMTGALNQTFDIPFVLAGGGVTIQNVTPVTGRDTVDLPTITIRENAYGAFVPGGEIALELPLGFRFIPGAITLGGFITANPVANSVTNNTAWNTGAFPSNVINPSVANDFFATLPRDGVNASSVVIITLPDTLPAGIAGVPRTLTIAGLRIESVAGRWDNAITGPVDITFHTGADTFGFRAGAVNRTLRPAWRTSNVSYIRVANFADFGVDFAVIPGGGGVGNVPTIVAGWLPADGNLAGRAHPLHHDRGVGRNITSGAGAWGNVASVRVEEVVPRSLWGTHGFTFTLVDADGNVHPYASIRSVNLASSVQGLPGGAAATTNETNHPSMVSANFINQRTPLPNNFPHIVNNVSDLAGIVQGGAQAGTRQNASVFFSEDGRSVSVDRLEVGSAVRDTGRLRLDAHFALTADVNFEGGIYIVVTHGGQALPGGFDRMDLPQVLVANVRRAIEVETEVTPVTVGFQTYSVADITVREVQAGDFRTGVNSIQLSLGEYHTGFVAGHQGNLQFVPITTANVRNHIDVRGAVNSQSRVGATLQPFHFVGDMLSINIGAPTRGDVPSYIHLSGLAVRAVRDVPQGYYQLVVRGSSVLNNENFFNNTGNGANMNVRVPANVNDPFLRPNESSWRRYAHGPMMVDYIEVTTPGGITVGQGDGQDGQPVVPVVTPDVTVFWAPGTGYQVNGAARTFAGGMTSINNAATGRTYLPITALVTALGGTFYWDDSNVGGNRYLTTTIPHAAYETVTWVFPAGEARAETVVIVDGFGSRAVTNAPFLTGTTEANAANNQRTFVPARGMINAHGLIAVDNAATGQTVISVR